MFARLALKFAIAAALTGCGDAGVGDTPVDRCVPAGACDEGMFKSGISADQGVATRGAAIYAKDCVRCHGEAGKGIAEARRIDMTSPAWQASLRDGTIVKTVRAGRTPMPAFTFTDQELKDLLAHIRQLEVTPPSTPAPQGY